MYTFDRNPRAEARIEHDQAVIAAAVRESIPEKYLAAVVLIGGYGRGQGGYVIDDEGRACPYNDYDYFVIFRHTSRRAARRYIERLPVRELEKRTGIEVDFFPLLERDLGHLEFSLMYAEMQAAHKVILGNPNVLGAMRPMPLDALPMTEMVRLMTNRGYLLLLNCLDENHERYATYINKAVLAAGDAWLASRGSYDVDYNVKRSRLLALCDDEQLVAGYDRAVSARFRPDLGESLDIEDQKVATAIWLRTLKTIEAERLGEACDWRAYDSPLLRKQERGSWLKNMVLNARDSRLRAGLKWYGRHPRERVISALPAMLAGQNRDQASQFIDLWYSYS